MMFLIRFVVDIIANLTVLEWYDSVYSIQIWFIYGISTSVITPLFFHYFIEVSCESMNCVSLMFHWISQILINGSYYYFEKENLHLKGLWFSLIFLGTSTLVYD